MLITGPKIVVPIVELADIVRRLHGFEATIAVKFDIE
jgi:hypothetical protein